MRNQKHKGQIGDYWLSQRSGSANWYRTWFDPKARQTRRASLGTESFREAEIKLARWVVENETIRDEQPDDVPLDTVFVRYYQKHAINTRSKDNARGHLRLWSEFWAGAMLSDLFDSDRQEAFLGFLRDDRGFSDGYIQRIQTTGRAAVNWAHKKHLVRSVPHIEVVTSNATRDRILTMDESAALFNATETDHLLMYLMLAFNTAARPEAILELTRSQLDFDARLIDFNVAGRKQTKKFRPVLPMTETILPWLRNAGPGFMVEYRGKKVGSIKTAFNKARDRAGLGKDVVPYTIRHTVATELRKRGVQGWELAGFMGHKARGYGTTERYAKYAPDYMSDAARAIDEFFSQMQKQVDRGLIPINLRTSCVSLRSRETSQVTDLLERERRLELPTSTLARLRSTN